MKTLKLKFLYSVVCRNGTIEVSLNALSMWQTSVRDGEKMNVLGI